MAVRMGVSICADSSWLQTSGCLSLGSVVCGAVLRGLVAICSLSLCWLPSFLPSLPFLPFLFLSASLSLPLYLSSLPPQCTYTHVFIEQLLCAHHLGAAGA